MSWIRFNDRPPPPNKTVTARNTAGEDISFIWFWDQLAPIGGQLAPIMRVAIFQKLFQVTDDGVVTKDGQTLVDWLDTDTGTARELVEWHIKTYRAGHTHSSTKIIIDEVEALVAYEKMCSATRLVFGYISQVELVKHVYRQQVVAVHVKEVPKEHTLVFPVDLELLTPLGDAPQTN